MWFRRRAFSADYADTTPKWHLLAEADGPLRIAICEYRYEFYYDSPLTQEEQPDRADCCRKCLQAAPAAASPPDADGKRWTYVVRFPTEAEQAKGMLIVPRHKRRVQILDSASKG